MITKIEKFNQDQLKKNQPDINPGDSIKVHQKIKEGGKERIQIFEGLVLARKHGRGLSSNITVRKIVQGVGVERIFPINSPMIEKIEIVRKGRVKRAKLYYLRTAKGKRAKLKHEELSQAIAEPAATPAEETPVTPAAPEQK
jgi:large subunit ribosomal protein L19